MRTTLPLILCAALTVTGCARVAESRFNPLNWFGDSAPVQNTDARGNLRPLVPAGAVTQAVDRRPLIATVDSMAVERTPDGAIVRATGTAATLGQFNAQLVPVAVTGSTLTLAFRAEVPAGAISGGPVVAHQITVARVLDEAELAGIQRIEVQAQQNARVSSR